MNKLLIDEIFDTEIILYYYSISSYEVNRFYKSDQIINISPKKFMEWCLHTMKIEDICTISADFTEGVLFCHSIAYKSGQTFSLLSSFSSPEYDTRCICLIKRIK
jgi:hypothetical protein